MPRCMRLNIFAYGCNGCRIHEHSYKIYEMYVRLNREAREERIENVGEKKLRNDVIPRQCQCARVIAPRNLVICK